MNVSISEKNNYFDTILNTWIDYVDKRAAEDTVLRSGVGPANLVVPLCEHQWLCKSL